MAEGRVVEKALDTETAFGLGYLNMMMLLMKVTKRVALKYVEKQRRLLPKYQPKRGGDLG